MKKHTWLVNYTTANGKTITKTFETWKECFEFTEKLDKRIAKGTCGGYTGTRLG